MKTHKTLPTRLKHVQERPARRGWGIFGLATGLLLRTVPDEAFDSGFVDGIPTAEDGHDTERPDGGVACIGLGKITETAGKGGGRDGHLEGAPPRLGFFSGPADHRHRIWLEAGADLGAKRVMG